MSRRRSREAIEAQWQAFRDGAAARGVPEAAARSVFEKVLAFSAFGFPKAHAAAFALLAYQSTWLRHYYPAEFLCAAAQRPADGLLPAGLAGARRASGAASRCAASTINARTAACDVEPDGAVRIGLGYVRGLGEEGADEVIAERERGGPFRYRRATSPAA